MSHWSAPWMMGGHGFGASAGAVDTVSGVTWVMVPAGTVNVYSPKHDRMVPITLSQPILMSQTPITQRQYSRVMHEEPNYRFIGQDKPADSVVYGAAEAFCQRIGARLPSDTEFVYAAQGNADPAWAKLGTYGAIHDIAWYAENSLGMTHAVGGKRPNSLGLYDMLGNVAVWTTSSKDGGRTRKVYGASWASPLDMVRVTNNFDIPHRTENPSVGFRCVKPYVAPAPTRGSMLEMEEMSPATPYKPPEDRRVRQLELDGMRRRRR